MTTAYSTGNPTLPRSHARCPGCHSTFFVSAAQLKQGNGFVRCQRCLKLFFGDDLLGAPARLSPRATESKVTPVTEKISFEPLPRPTPQAPATGFLGLCPPSSTPATSIQHPPKIVAREDHTPDLPLEPVYLDLAPIPFDNNVARELLKKKVPSALNTAIPDPIAVSDAYWTQKPDPRQVFTAEPPVEEMVFTTADLEPPAKVDPPMKVSVAAHELPSFTAFASDEPPAAPERPSAHPTTVHASSALLPMQQAFLKTIDLFAYLAAACGFWLWQQLLKFYHLLSPRAWLNAASVSMVLVLTANGLWWQRDKLAEIPALRPSLEAACKWMSCTLAPYKDTRKILVENRILESHPTIPGGLRLHAIIKNESPFPQPFANVALYFLDPAGHPIAERDFKPQDYVESVNGRIPLMPPHTPIQLTLDMADPGKQATGYMLAFQ